MKCRHGISKKCPICKAGLRKGQKTKCRTCGVTLDQFYMLYTKKAEHEIHSWVGKW